MERKIPRSVLEDLADYCRGKEEDGRPSSDVLRDYLELMRRYADYFFQRPWPQTLEKDLGLSEEDVDFIVGAETFEEWGTRYTLACLRRNMSLEGFDGEGFDNDLKCIGRDLCVDCSVRDAMRLRKFVKESEEARRMVEEKVKSGEPSQIYLDWHRHLSDPETLRNEGFNRVELRLYEEMGGAEGKKCDVENIFWCPYEEEGLDLVERGRHAKEDIWCHLWWYDRHWNRSSIYSPAGVDMEWYHFDEPGIVDVASFGDVLKAIEDGRMGKIIEVHERYMKAKGYSKWAL